jgi:hypothetical protein
MELFIGKGCLNKLKNTLPGGNNHWMMGIPVYPHIAFPFVTGDGDVVLGCLIKDSGDMILLVDRALPFTTA